MEGYSNWTRVENIEPFELSELLNTNSSEVAVIDVREPWEYKSDTGHVGGSLLIPMNDIPDRLDEFRSLAGKKIALICHSGERSYYAAQFLKENRIDNVVNVNGGIIRWLQSGLTVEYEQK